MAFSLDPLPAFRGLAVRKGTLMAVLKWGSLALSVSALFVSVYTVTWIVWLRAVSPGFGEFDFVGGLLSLVGLPLWFLSMPLAVAALLCSLGTLAWTQRDRYARMSFAMACAAFILVSARGCSKAEILFSVL